MKKSISLFGTSADPPTIGHKKILEELSKIYAFTISYVSNNPNKNHKEDISIRSHLLKTLIEDLDNPKILFNQSGSSQWAIESIKFIFWIIIAGSIKEALLLISISFAANFPSIFLCPTVGGSALVPNNAMLFPI